jgi:hypothetical protein
MGEAKRRRAARDWEASGKRLGDAPVQEEYHDKMVATIQALDELFNGQVGGPGRKTGFVLMVFPFDEVAPGGQGRCNYMSNGADRRDIVTLMKEMIRRFEGAADPGSGRA